MSEKNNPVQKKLSDLAEIVAWFQGSDFELEKAVEKFKIAEKLADEIEHDLLEIKNDIQIIKKRFDS